MEKRVTPPDLKEMKLQGQKITMLTAYDYPTARVVDEAGIDVILIGDSLGNVILGYENTLPVTMDEQLHHVKAVSRGCKRALLVADMPYMSFQISHAETVRNAGRFIKEGHAQAVKLEGGQEMIPVIDALLHARIPVMGHIGLTPQSLNIFGGYKVQGKEKSVAEKLINDAQKLEKAGIFALVLEGIPWPVSKRISESLTIPTIGIGAGLYCDGQVLVFHDMIGFTFDTPPKFVRQYCNARELFSQAITGYINDVQNQRFPNKKESYSKTKFKDGVN